MRARQTFAAPWGLSLKLLTALSVGILLSVPLIGLYSGPRHLFLWTSSMVLLPLLVGAAFFVIRGYTVSGQTLRIHRLGWDSTLDLQQLRSATVDPEAMRRSLRTFGNGGLFCFAGRFRSQKLGPYRAFATDPKRAVVLTFADRTVVVTPDDPAAFVAQLQAIRVM